MGAHGDAAPSLRWVPKVHPRWIGRLVNGRRVHCRRTGLLARLAALDERVRCTAAGCNAPPPCALRGLRPGARFPDELLSRANLRAVRGRPLRAASTTATRTRFLLAHGGRTAALHDVERLLYADLAVVLPGDYLVKVDVALMASSVEGRSPFLDVRTMELGARIPLGVKLSPWRPKHLLKRVATDLGLPAAAIHRPKQGFGAPVGAWLRGPLRATARDCLLGGLPARGVVDGATIRRFWAGHEQGDDAHATRLWILLCLELWLRRCVDARAGERARASA